MTLGYQCDAECDNLADQAFGTVTLDLSALPESQGFQLAFVLCRQGIVDLDDSTYFGIHAAMQDFGQNEFEGDLPMVELHFCAGHTLTILEQMGVADIPQEGDVQTTLDEDQNS